MEREAFANIPGSNDWEQETTLFDLALQKLLRDVKEEVSQLCSTNRRCETRD